MKLIVLILVSITVFMANCRERPDSREISDDDNNLSDDQNFFDDRDLSDASDLSDARDRSDARDLSDGHNLSDGRDLTDIHDLSDGANNETSTTEPESFPADPMDLLSSLVDRQLKEEGRVQNKRKLRGSGGSKCKSDIVCSLLGGSCVTNSTYCSGREVPSVCSGAKCKCCITVNLEVKMHDLETELRAMVVNLTSANSNLNTKLDSIMSTNSNLTIANSNMDLKMDFIMSTNSNLTIADSKMDLKMDSMMATNSNLTIANSNIDLKIDSIMSTNSNLTIENSVIKNDLEYIKDNLTNANANQDLKLDSIMEHQGCPAGFFLLDSSNQCFRALTDTKRTWDNAKSACRALGLELAQPYDPVSLQAYMVNKRVVDNACWIDGRGDGSNIRWQRAFQAIISSKYPYWYPGTPGGAVTTNHCLGFLTHDHWSKNKQVYYSGWGCSVTRWTLCELVTK